MFVSAIIIGTIVLAQKLPSKTREERFQERVANVSQSPHIDDRGTQYIVEKVLDNFPDSTLVRVVLVPIGEGAILVALHPRCEPLVIEVGLF